MVTWVGDDYDGRVEMNRLEEELRECIDSDEKRWGEVVWDEIGLGGMGLGGMRWDGMRGGGMGWNEMRWHTMGWEGEVIEIE